MYKITKTVCGKYCRTCAAVIRDRQEHPLKTETEKEDRCFIPETEADHDINAEPIAHVGMYIATTKSPTPPPPKKKKKKKPGQAKFKAELLKIDTE